MRQHLEIYFPTYGDRNVQLYYLINFFSNSFFFIGCWLFFWTKYLTLGEVGWIDATTFGAALLLEIPSGAVADIFGKKYTLVLSKFLCVVGALLQAIAVSKGYFFFGNLLFSIGWTFHSGAADALLYDSMLERKSEKHFDTVISRAGFLNILALVLAASVGGLLFAYHERLPFFAVVVVYLITLGLCFFLREPKIDSYIFTWKNYLSQLKIGFYELLQTSLRRYFLLFAVVSGVFFAYEAGLIRPALYTHFGYDGVTQSFAFALCTIIAGISVIGLKKIRRVISDSQGMILLAVLLSLCFFFAGFSLSLIPGFFIVMIIAIIGNIATPWISIIVNKEIDSKYRATTLSTLTFFTKLPYVFIAIYAGSLLQAGKISYFMWGMSAVVLAIVSINELFFRFIKK